MFGEISFSPQSSTMNQIAEDPKRLLGQALHLRAPLSSGFKCYDSEGSNKLKLVDCSLFKENPKKNTKRQVGNNEMFITEIDCQSPKTGFCDKAKAALETAGKIISDVIKFTEPIITKTTFKPLGSGCPSRFIGLKGGDGVVRLYPQPLVKQFGLATHPEFLPADITLTFSSDYDFWFEDDVTPITRTQMDFLSVVLHELIHGLGFVSLWQSYSPDGATGLTPYIQKIPSDGTFTPFPPLATSDNAITFNGFIESIFDRFVISLPSGTPLSSFTSELNKFAPIGAQFASMDDLITSFKASAQYEIAADILESSTTALSLGFLAKGIDFQESSINDVPDDRLLYLETNIQPYSQSSSISHASQDLYAETREFLMTFAQFTGRTLEDAINNTGGYVGGAIGPKLKSVLESMGYMTVDNLAPEIPTLPDLPIVLK
ncbi:17969_t:CDS:2 [Entrophospora sp. SA101]|nr:22276_t:CDS:2 [Entrophospora sp. SA101]CAJ0837785.1 17969_t:CDS:2 [Entrophospora sp. SA101]